MEVIMKQLSSLYKIRGSEELKNTELLETKLFRNEHFDYEVSVYTDAEVHHRFSVEANGLKPVLYFVQDAVMDYPCFADHDDDLLSAEPCMMPDILIPAEEVVYQQTSRNSVVTAWIDLTVSEDTEAGDYEIRVQDTIEETGEVFEKIMKVSVLPFEIPKQKTYFTQWFHVDCIAEAYRVPVYSEAHWELIEKFMKAGSFLDFTLILTPVLTPALDTKVGTERPCTQLAGITEENGIYHFDFSKLGRYIDLARKYGIENFEISHLFSQWGLKFAPNIYVNGEHRFGWNTDAKSDEYRAFLQQFLPALVSYLEEKEALSHAYFHLSDEPHEAEHLENYRYAEELVRPFLKGRPILDALSNVEFYKQGLMDIPVTATNAIEAFLPEKIEQQWVYYCCGQYRKTGNRFLAFPSYRNRILGTQIYRYNVKGFLQWGFNFYYGALSRYRINPYLTTSGEKSWPSGDPFSVYPGPEGPLYSLRALIFKDALQDVEIFRMLEEKTSREYVEKLIDEAAGQTVTFEDYPRDYVYVPSLIARVKEEIIHGEA